MTDRLSALADHAEIETLLVRYCRALDRLDMDLLRGLFTPDAHVTLGSFHDGGVDGFVPVVQGFMGSMERTQHSLSNVLIELSGDEAASEAHVFAHHVDRTGEGPFELIVGARYLSRARRTPEGWRLSAHSEVMDWGTRRPMGDWFDQSRDMQKGTRGPGDPSYGYLS
jgi:hypothetical protein